MDPHLWLLYTAAALGLSLSPGPNSLLALTHGALHGRRNTLHTLFGGSIGFLLIIALSLFGIGALLKASLVWLSILKWVGGAYLVWLGIQVWRPADRRRKNGPSRKRAGLTALSPGLPRCRDQSEGHPVLRGFSAAVRGSRAQHGQPVRCHGDHLRAHRIHHRVRAGHPGATRHDLACACGSNVQQGLWRHVRGDRGAAAPAREEPPAALTPLAAPLQSGARPVPTSDQVLSRTTSS